MNGYITIDELQAELETHRNVVCELVACQDLKRQAARTLPYDVRVRTDADYTKYSELTSELGRREPLAWAAARALSTVATPGEPK